ncbi:MAG: response regulator [Deltaproteobacteria bacterium]|nr:MAG: response regulator [Deltaproteobacteria bacterium]TMQ12557.1 MAG: response regulator [Deltaproteobacteria bacterium]
MPSAIVVDSPIMRTQLGKLLELAGFSVVAQAGAADHLLELYEQHRPDLITLDIVVPGRDLNPDYAVSVFRRVLQYTREIPLPRSADAPAPAPGGTPGPDGARGR